MSYVSAIYSEGIRNILILWKTLSEKRCICYLSVNISALYPFLKSSKIAMVNFTLKFHTTISPFASTRKTGFQYNFWVKTMCGSFFLPTLFPYQMVLVPFNINMMVSLVEQELLTLLSSSPVFNGVHVARYLVFCVVFYKLLFVLLSAHRFYPEIVLKTWRYAIWQIEQHESHQYK
jgi:hypothetical protein